MLTQLNQLPHSAKHCGIVNHLRVRSTSPTALKERARAAAGVHAFHRNRICLYIGEAAASLSPVVMDTLLGSCVSVCLYDPKLRAGGMNHILLPKCRVGDESSRCGVHAMELLINELMKLGADRRRFVAKAFGGANVLQGILMPSVGDGNIRFVHEFLATEKIPLIADRLGGNHAVHLYFQTDTGKATVRTVDGSSLPKILASERTYCKPVSTNEPYYGEITLF